MEIVGERVERWDGECWWQEDGNGWGGRGTEGREYRGGMMENGMAGGRDASGAKDGAEDGVRQSGDGA